MVTSLVKCKSCGKQKLTRNDKFRCCKLLQDVKSCLIAQGEAIRTSIDVENITLGTKENAEKKQKVPSYLIDGNGEKHPLGRQKTDIQPENLEENKELKGDGLENEQID